MHGERKTIPRIHRRVMLLLVLGLAMNGCGEKRRARGGRRTKQGQGQSDGEAVAQKKPPGRLSAADLFGKKKLSGRPPRGFQWSRDGKTLFFLRPSAKDARILDLWHYRIGKKKAALLLRAEELAGGRKTELSEAQKAAQERRRVRHRGITRYGLDHAGRGVVIPLAGYLYHYDLEQKKVTRLFDTPGGEMEARLAPAGDKLAFVRQRDLVVKDLASGRERVLADSKKDTIKYGVAEFVAQEELGRYTGYWWSKDGKWIALTEVDVSPVQVALRPQYSASGVKVVRQRYPAAGTENARVRLGVVRVSGGAVRWIDTGPQRDFYLARVKWTEKGLAFQILSRDQRTLTLRLADPRTGRSRVVLSETDARYINLHDDFESLGKQEGFVWSTEKSGRRQIVRYGWNGEKKAQISKKPYFIKAVVAVDRKAQWIYAQVPVAKGRGLALLRFCLRGRRKPVRLTPKQGWHAVTMNRTADHFVDRFSKLTTPPQVRVRDRTGKPVVVLDANPATALKGFVLAKTETVQIPTADNVVLNGVLFWPPAKPVRDKLPAVIYTYGGPHGQTAADRWSRMELWHHYLAQRGFVVLAFDGRGTGNRGKKFEGYLYKAFGKVDVQDVQAAARWVSSHPRIDGKRLGLWGWSYGGYLTVMTLLETKALFRAGLAVAPLADWSFYDTAYTERYLGRPQQNKAVYKQANPIRRAGSLATRLQLIHGMSDDNVLLRHTLMLSEAFQKNGSDFEMMLYPGKKHSLKGTAIRKHLLRRIHRFFSRALQP